MPPYKLAKTLEKDKARYAKKGWCNENRMHDNMYVNQLDNGFTFMMIKKPGFEEPKKYLPGNAPEDEELGESNEAKINTMSELVSQLSKALGSLEGKRGEQEDDDEEDAFFDSQPHAEGDDEPPVSETAVGDEDGVEDGADDVTEVE